MPITNEQSVIQEQVIFAPSPPPLSANQTVAEDGTITITNEDGSITIVPPSLTRVVQTGEPIQHKERYSRIGSGWQLKISVDGYTKRIDAGPIEMPDGLPLSPLESLLSDDSGLIIVKIEWPIGSDSIHYLCSPTTKAWIDLMREERNPHRSPVSNGLVEIKPIEQTTPGNLARVGSTIPIITVDVSSIQKIGESQADSLKTAGIDDVQFIYETNSVEGSTVPSGLVQQINYTIAKAQERAQGSFTNYIIPFLKDDYRAYIEEIRILRDKSAQAEKVFLNSKLSTFQETVYPLWQQIVKEFNALQNMFLNGVIPSTDLTLGSAPAVPISAGPTTPIVPQQIIKETEPISFTPRTQPPTPTPTTTPTTIGGDRRLTAKL